MASLYVSVYFIVLHRSYLNSENLYDEGYYEYYEYYELSGSEGSEEHLYSEIQDTKVKWIAYIVPENNISSFQSPGKLYFLFI